ASVSISNLNDAKATSWPIVLYVVEAGKAHDIAYEIYDAAFMPLISTFPNAIITVMSAVAFSVNAPKMGSSNSGTARLVGFDTTLENNGDKCPFAFKTMKNPQFEGFNLQINVPIISFIFGERNGVKLQADTHFMQLLDLIQSRFISSPGYNGCKKPLNGGIQGFRS
ncbi:hypothetical protein PFISCL1PPCAC_19095, partial [Pristionchus fissidentatus]